MSGRRVAVTALVRLLVGVSLLGLAGPARAEQRSRAAAPAGLTAGDWQGIVDEIRQRPYRLVPAAGGGYAAANPAQGWTVAFNGGGADVRPTAADWTWGLRFVAYGYPGAERSVSVSPRLTMEGARADYHWDEGLTEWLRNGPDGLKQTFVLAERPGPDMSAGPLGIALRVAGDLQPRLVEAGQGVSFADAGGVERIAYRGLVVSDAMGQRMPAWFEVSERLVRLRVDDQEALYPLTVDPIAQQAYLKASNTDAGDLFGLSVAISGDTLVVAAFVEASAATGVNGNQADNTAARAGAAYVFVRSGGVWTQQAYLKASNTDAGDYFSGSVAIDGDTLVVGASGEASAATGVNGNQADNTMSGAGAAYVFVRSGTVWTQQAYLKASNTDLADNFGASVAISGDTVVVGAPREASAATGVNGNQLDNTASEAGAAYVFVRSGTVWTQQAYLKASNAATGENNFGRGVAISGDTVVVGAANEGSAATGVDGNQADNTAARAGAAYVFTGLAGPGHTLTITSGPSGTPNPVDSDGTASLSVTAVDSLKHLVSYAWSASCPTRGANGTFSDAAAANPMWTAPTNTTGSPEDCTIAVLVSDGEGLSQSASYVHTVSSGSTTFGCPALPTYASIDCRLDGLIASLGAAQDLGKLKKRLVKMATKARTQKQKAESFATTKKKREKKLLKKAVKGLSKFLRTVGSRAATKLLPPGTRQTLTAQTSPILADMKTLLGAL